MLFSLKDTTASLAEIDKLQLHRGSTSDYVYFDDFKIEEYKVGMNLAPNSNGAALPITNKNADTLFGLFPSVTLGTDNTDPDNKVWQFASFGGAAKCFQFSGNYASVMTAGKEFEISFRYKGVDNAEAEAQLAIPDANNAEFVGSQVSSADELLLQAEEFGVSSPEDGVPFPAVICYAKPKGFCRGHLQWHFAQIVPCYNFLQSENRAQYTKNHLL